MTPDPDPNSGWLKSPRDDNGCLWVKYLADGRTMIRSDRSSRSLVVSAGEWDPFLASAKAGVFDRDR